LTRADFDTGSEIFVEFLRNLAADQLKRGQLLVWQEHGGCP
jgi:hypothetical protein